MHKNRVTLLGTLLLLLVLMLLAAVACGGETPADEPAATETEDDGQQTTDDGQTQTAEPTVAAPATATDAPVAPTEAPAEPTAEPATAQPAAPASYAVGDIVAIDDLSLAVLGWRVSAGDDFFQPDPGNQFVIVDLLFVNTGATAESLSTMLQMELKDSEAHAYTIDLSATTVAGASPDGELSPGERIRASVGFQVPAAATGLQFVFDASLFGADRVFIDLGPAPVAVEPPPPLAGETAPATAAVGETVELGGLALTVYGVTYPAGGDFSQPDEGMRFVAVDVAVENRTTSAQSISSMLQMGLKDSTGQRYKVDLTAQMASGGTSPDGELAPGETLRGPVGFQVPIGATGLLFLFDADPFTAGDRAFVALPAP